MLIVVVSIVGMVLVSLIGLYTARDNLIEERKVKSRSLVELAASLAQAAEARARAGEIPLDVAKADALARIRELRYEDDNYFWVNDLDGILLMHPHRANAIGTSVLGLKDAAGTLMYQKFLAVARESGAGFVDYVGRRPGTDVNAAKLSYVKTFTPWGWVIGTGIYVDDVDAVFRRRALELGVMVLGIVGLIALISALVARGILRPLHRIGEDMRRVADGDTDREIAYRTDRSEFGDLARAVQVFKDSTARVRAMERDQHEAQIQAQIERKQTLLLMAHSFETSVMGQVERVSAQSAAMQGTSEAMARAAERVTDQVSQVADAGRQVTANVQTVAAATEELSASIAEISRQVGAAAQVSAAASDRTAETNAMVEGLAQAATRIGDVIGLINDIASQTNLLALNATIEAARAGEAGKGFAVVAGEVKTLANQTARATEEISTQIAAIQTETRRSVEAIHSIGTVIDQVRQISAGIAAAVEQQGAATHEIARNVQQAASGTESVSVQIAAIHHSSEAAKGSWGEMLGTSGDLARSAATLRAEVSRFLDGVRAG
jgi:methyl-accepting chemotaxis protein